jgi:hypothetical protein
MLGLRTNIGSISSSVYTWTTLISGQIRYRRGIDRVTLQYVLDYSEDGGVTLETLISENRTEDTILQDKGHLYRHRIVDYDYHVDQTLTGTGYAGTEGVDWENLAVYDGGYSSYSSTDYFNLGGIGDRRSIIDVTATSGLFVGDLSHFVNGVLDLDFSIYPNLVAVAEKFLNFDFKSGSRKLIDEAKLIQLADAYTNGTWIWQGSNEESTTPTFGSFVDIGTSFVLSATLNNHHQFFTSLNGNTVGYRHYRLLGVSGSIGVGQPWLYEMQFKIANNL